MIKYDGIEYDDPLSSFELKYEQERELLESWKSHFENLGIDYIVHPTTAGRVKLLVNKEQNQKLWQTEFKCGDKLIRSPDPMFGEFLDKGSREVWDEVKRIHISRSK